MKYCFMMLLSMICGLSAACAGLPGAPDGSGLPGGPGPKAGTGRTLTVGPGQAYALPSEAAFYAWTGDTVLIAPGTYRDCAVWKASGLTIKPLGWPRGGRVHMKDKTCAGKGIFVIDGNNVIIEGLIFSGARVRDRNGAGIRLQGGDATIRNVQFLDNENGILMNPNAGASVLIEDSLFERNGTCIAACAHGLYIGHIRQLIVRNSVFRGQKQGHHIKSRAVYTEITGNRIEDGRRGTASYLIDLPNGGNALIEGNRLHKGPRAENFTAMIAIAGEGLSTGGGRIVVKNNDVRSDLPNPVALVRRFAEVPVEISGNRVSGNVTTVMGP